MASCSLVPTDTETAGVRIARASQAKFRPTAASLAPTPSTAHETATPGCATIRQDLEAQGFPGDVREIMCAS